MAPSAQEKEFNVFGIPKLLRGGVMIGFLAISLGVNIVLFRLLKQSDEDKVQMQKELYEQMIRYVNPTVERMNQAASKVDTTTARVDSALNNISKKDK